MRNRATQDHARARQGIACNNHARADDDVPPRAVSRMVTERQPRVHAHVDRTVLHGVGKTTAHVRVCVHRRSLLGVGKTTARALAVVLRVLGLLWCNTLSAAKTTAHAPGCYRECTASTCSAKTTAHAHGYLSGKNIATDPEG